WTANLAAIAGTRRGSPCADGYPAGADASAEGGAEALREADGRSSPVAPYGTLEPLRVSSTITRGPPGGRAQLGLRPLQRSSGGPISPEDDPLAARRQRLVAEQPGGQVVAVAWRAMGR